MTIRKNVISTTVGAALAGAALISTAPVQACGNDGTLGAICMTAATFCPRNTVDTSGQLLAISQFSALYALIGTNYGGDGRTSFGVPDLRGRTPVGYGQGIGLSPVQMGEKRGAESVVLNSQQLPTHTHTATFTASGGSATEVKASTSVATKPQAAAGDYIASNTALGGDPKFVPASGAGTTVALGGVSGSSGGGTVAVANAGSSSSVINISPQQGVRLCMYSAGMFPSRN